MTGEYKKKLPSFIRWFIPFIMTVFLLFGCGSAQNGQGNPASSGADGAAVETLLEEAEQAAEVLRETIEEASQEFEQEASQELAEEALQELAQEASQELAEEVLQEFTEEASQASDEVIDEWGSYTTKEDVALYIHTYGCLPGNFITKKEAEELGWVSREGNLWDVAPGMSIGGSRFGNYEGLLPDQKGRKWFECDINFDGSYRGAERIVYSNDGLIYYTEDHYESFEQLY